MMSQADKNLGLRIKEVVKKIGGHREASLIACVSESAIFRYIQGENKPSFITVSRLSEAAAVDLNWVAQGIGTANIQPVAQPVDESVMLKTARLCRDIGIIAESNCHYMEGLTRRIQATGKAVEELTLAELLAIDHDYELEFNQAYSAKGGLL